MTNDRQVAVVTGGAGFIGSHMVDLLIENNYVVRVIDNLSGGHKNNLKHLFDHPNLQIYWEDIRELEAGHPAFEYAHFIFHFAGIGDIVPSIEQPIDYMSVNVQGTVNVLECARQANVKKFVYAASSSCYGLTDTPTSESATIGPEYPYALSKYLGEQTAMHWYKVYHLPCNAVRIFNAYGTRSRTTGAYGAVFGVFLKQKLAKEPFTVVGDGKQTRDFIYVTDIARAFLAAAQTPLCGEIWNAGAGNPQSINRLVELLGGDTVYLPKRPGEPDSTHADIRKIQNQLGWQQTVSFEEGIARILADIQHWQDAPLWNEESIHKATSTWFKYMDSSR